jgi:hypothetical protein
MHHLTVTPALPSRNPPTLEDLKVGQVGEIISQTYKGHIVMRTYDGFVSLMDPETTFDTQNGHHHQIQIVPAGTTISIKLSV